MARAIRVVKNDTHWKSSDIGKMVRLCTKGAGADQKRRRDVEVHYSKSADCAVSLEYASHTQMAYIYLYLPKRGRRSDRAPLVQLAQAKDPSQYRHHEVLLHFFCWLVFEPNFRMRWFCMQI